MDYNASGRVRVNGCAGTGWEGDYQMKYSVGQRVWIKKKAILGIAESVVVKRLNRKMLDRISYTGIDWQAFYTDTFNRIWREDELISEAESSELIAKYEQKEFENFKKMYDEGACFPIKPEGCL